MSLVEFRNMENKAQNKSNPKAKQDLKLSFRKLAAALHVGLVILLFM